MTSTSSNPSRDLDLEFRIVVGTDGSDCARRAVEFAGYEAAIRGALLHVVCAYDLPPAAGWAVSPGPFEQSAASIVETSISFVHSHYPNLVVKGEHIHGYAGKVLVEAAAGASLLVVGSRGHSYLTELLIGSVSEYCVHHATCSTLIIR